MTQLETLALVQKILSVAMVLQTLELLQAKERIARLWPAWILGPFHLSESGLSLLFSLRLVFASILFFLPTLPVLAALVVIQYLLYRHFRGPFNGGSDSMTSTVLLSLSLAALIPSATKLCLIYIAVQATLSYFVAGLVKLRQQDWRSGKALNEFLELNEVPLRLGREMSLVIILFECAFPLALVWDIATLPMLALALTFHLMNALYLGLNRFVLAWLATYPTIVFAAGLLP